MLIQIPLATCSNGSAVVAKIMLDGKHLYSSTQRFPADHHTDILPLIMVVAVDVVSYKTNLLG